MRIEFWLYKTLMNFRSYGFLLFLTFLIIYFFIALGHHVGKWEGRFEASYFRGQSLEVYLELGSSVDELLYLQQRLKDETQVRWERWESLQIDAEMEEWLIGLDPSLKTQWDLPIYRVILVSEATQAQDFVEVVQRIKQLPFVIEVISSDTLSGVISEFKHILKSFYFWAPVLFGLWGISFVGFLVWQSRKLQSEEEDLTSAFGGTDFFLFIPHLLCFLIAQALALSFSLIVLYLVLIQLHNFLANWNWLTVSHFDFIQDGDLKSLVLYLFWFVLFYVFVFVFSYFLFSLRRMSGSQKIRPSYLFVSLVMILFPTVVYSQKNVDAELEQIELQKNSIRDFQKNYHDWIQKYQLRVIERNYRNWLSQRKKFFNSKRTFFTDHDDQTEKHFLLNESLVLKKWALKRIVLNKEMGKLQDKEVMLQRRKSYLLGIRKQNNKESDFDPSVSKRVSVADTFQLDGSKLRVLRDAQVVGYKEYPNQSLAVAMQFDEDWTALVWFRPFHGNLIVSERLKQNDVLFDGLTGSIYIEIRYWNQSIDKRFFTSKERL